MNYHNITHDDQNNGDGLRVVLWVAGCSHHCYKCQNPQTWDPYDGILFDESAKEEIFDELSKDYISGITLSGGDPLYENNLSTIAYLVDEIRQKFPTKTIWLYTGFEWDLLMAKINQPIFPNSNFEHLVENHKKRQEIIFNVDVVVDGPYIDAQRDVTLKWRGSANQRVIDVKESKKQDKIVLYCD